MPLKPGSDSKTISENIKEMIRAGHPHNVSVAAALSNARRHHAAGGLAGYAKGGYPKTNVNMNPVRENFHIGGLFHGNTMGRGDKIKTAVPNGSHIIPADIVSGIGEGNTLAGAKALDGMFSMPHGIKAGKSAHGMGIPNAHKSGFSQGGTAQTAVPVFVSDGEYAVHPDVVKNHPKLGNGDQKHGHDVLDKFIVHMRKKITDKMKKLPGPKKK